MRETFPKTTLKDVSRVSGFAISTVSDILRNSSHCWASQTTRARVFEAAQKTGYRCNRLARGLVLQKTECLAVIIPDQRNPVYTEVVHGVVMEAERRDYEVFFCSTEDSIEREKEYIERLADRRCDGIILMPVHGMVDAKVIEFLARANIPWIAVGPPVPGIPGDYIFAHFDEGTRQITRHLLRLGRKKIVFLAAGMTREVMKPWVDGFRHTLNETGMNASADAIRYCGPGMQEVYHTVKEIFAVPRDVSDALVCVNDFSAIAACRAIEEYGLNIPRDVAVVGSDDIEMGAYLHVPLTTVRYGVQEIGRQAVRMLFERIEEPSLHPRMVWHEPTLVIRQSCGYSGHKEVHD